MKGIFLNQLKIAKVIPVMKGDKTMCYNYRSITLTSKPFEKLFVINYKTILRKINNCLCKINVGSKKTSVGSEKKKTCRFRFN